MKNLGIVFVIASTLLLSSCQLIINGLEDELSTSHAFSYYKRDKETLRIDGVNYVVNYSVYKCVHCYVKYDTRSITDVSFYYRDNGYSKSAAALYSAEWQEQFVSSSRDEVSRKRCIYH